MSFSREYHRDEFGQANAARKEMAAWQFRTEEGGDLPAPVCGVLALKVCDTAARQSLLFYDRVSSSQTGLRLALHSKLALNS